jgi:hypothetical protein
MLLAGIQGRLGLDPRQRHAGVTDGEVVLDCFDIPLLRAKFFITINRPGPLAQR